MTGSTFRSCFATPISALALAQKSLFRQLNCGFFSSRSLDLGTAKQLLMRPCFITASLIFSSNLLAESKQTVFNCMQTGSELTSNNLYLGEGKTYRLFTTKGQAACKTFTDLENSGFEVKERICKRVKNDLVEMILTPSTTCYKDHSRSSPFYFCEMALSLEDGKVYGTYPNPCGAESIVGVRN